MYRALLLIACLALSSCSKPDGLLPIPNLDEFPQSSLSYDVKGTHDEALKQLDLFFTDRNIPKSKITKPGRDYIITSYINDLVKNSTKKVVYVTSVRIEIPTISESKTPPCIVLSITYLTKSRGKHEELWSSADQAEIDTSTLRQSIRDYANKFRCTQ